MSDDLVRRLACPYPKDEDVEEVTLPVWVILLTTEAADRIEELKGQLQSVLDRETSILRYYDAKLDTADAKLAKAVVLMEDMEKLPCSEASTGILKVMIRYTIAELSSASCANSKGEQL